jgi:tRNA nucleotidyltransferase (CCA-adding enzyme)
MDFVGRSYGIYKFRGFPLDIALPRNELRNGPNHRDFFVTTDPRMVVRDAARRRDFTINAIYYDPLRCEFQDPFRGHADLRDRKLKHVSSHFIEDPLRVLRGMQFVARFSLQADQATVDLCRLLSAEFLSPERIFGEFRKLLLFGKNIGDGLEFLDQCNWLRFFPEISALKTCEQDARFHPEGSVFEHIKHALNAFATMRPTDEFDALAIGFAVLCHDFGKPLCTRQDANGNLHTYGHEEAGVIPAQNFMRRLRAPNSLTECVSALVTCHMLPRRFASIGDEAISAVRHLALKVKRIDLLLAVARCDNMGRPPIIPNFSAENRLEQLAIAEGILTNPPAPLVRGRDLQSHFAISESAKMGEILNELFTAQLDGKFSSLEEGLEMAKTII